jgi:hypothetical protein
MRPSPALDRERSAHPVRHQSSAIQPTSSVAACLAKLAHWRRVPLLASVLLASAVYYGMAMAGVAHESGTYDEFAHATAGFSYWTYNDYRLNPENGNWPQRLLALPLVTSRLDLPSLDPAAWRRSDMWALSDQLFFAPGRDPDALLRRSRAVVALVGALLGVLVFYWSRSLFGVLGAWVSLSVFVFSPTMLAHGALATSDVIGAAFFTAATWALWTALHRVTVWTLLASTIAISGVFLSKLSAPALVPIALAMLVVRLAVGRPLKAAWHHREFEIRRRRTQAPILLGLTLTHVAVALCLIWASYGFRYSAFGNHQSGADDFIDPWAELVTDRSLPTRLVEWGRAHHALPEAYLYGASSVIAYSAHRASFLNGRVTTAGGWHWFFPYAAMVKTTLPGLFLVAAVPLMLLWRSREMRTISACDAREWAAWRAPVRGELYDLTPLILLIGIYWISAILNPLDIGYRHLLPIIPATIVLVGASGYVIARIWRDAPDVSDDTRQQWYARLARANARVIAPAALVVALVMWHVGESVHIAPHYLAYFNQLAGGPSHAYTHLVDSSLDWGQDLPGLKDWLDREGLQGPNHPPVFLSYFGTARPEYYHIDAQALPGLPDRWSPHTPEPLTAGVYCLSATMLEAVYLRAQGGWTPLYESDYQTMLRNLMLFDSTGVNQSTRAALLRQTGEDFWVKMFHAFEHFRLARLAAHLRTRQPDAEVGYSILIYRVTDAELARALFGPSP